MAKSKRSDRYPMCCATCGESHGEYSQCPMAIGEREAVAADADDLWPEFRRHVAVNLLKWAAGQTMFCPLCEVVLDYRRAVLFQSRTVCGPCFDKIRARVVEVQGEPATAARLAELAAELDYVDGRQLCKGRR